MVKKIFLSIFTVTVCALIFAIGALLFVTSSYMEGRIRTELSDEIDYLKAGVESEGEEYLLSLADGGKRVTWIASDGKILFDNGISEQGELYYAADTDEVKEAKSSKDGFGFSTRSSESGSGMTSYAAKRLSDGTIIIVASARYTIWTVLFDTMSSVAVISAITLIAGAVLAIILSGMIVKPISLIDFEKPEETHAYPELLPVVKKLSEQKRRIDNQIAELRLKQTEFEAITYNMSEGMITIDYRANVLTCNQSAMKILGCEKIPTNALSLSSSIELRQSIITALSGTKARAQLKTESSFYSIIATPVIEDGNVCGAVIVILDETEKERREALRREFTSNVSHELKTPLTSISGFAELIRDGVGSEKERAHFADNICKESSRMLSLIEDIIKLSRLDGGEIPYDKTDIDLYECALGVKERLTSIAQKKDITITLEGQSSFVVGNYNIVEDMIYNLCDNAIKYNNVGGSVTISVGEKEKRPFFSVSDNGIGIPPAEIPRIYERFYRVDKSHSKEIGGTGLGLSIVKHAAIYLHATINTESTLGKGTKITVTF